MSWLARLRETAAAPWQPVGYAAAAAVVAANLWMLFEGSFGDHWAPVLDHANLVFHEAGHVLFGLVSSRLAVYGGTLMQLIIPLAATAAFWTRRQPLGFALCLGWSCESLLNVATYMADARAMALPLIGGLDPETYHDWREIFSRWDMLELDEAWAALNRVIAWILGLGGCAWLLRQAARQRPVEQAS
jgi:hypothetical protein